MRTLCLALLLFASGCDCSGPDEGCTSDGDCPAGRCVDGECAADPDAGAMDAGEVPSDGGVDASSGEVCDSGIVCEGTCCSASQRCAHGGCVVDLGPCATNDDCRGDSYCDADGRCTPYGVPEGVVRDDDCEREITIGDFTPDEQCRWEGPDDDGPFSTWRQVYSAPMVADFDLDGDATVLAPSIVIATFADSSEGGILRVLDGRTCTEQAALTSDGDRLVYASNMAIGDLDGAPDGRPEIVGAALSGFETAGGIVAFGYDADAGTFVRRWYGRRCDLDGEPRHAPNEWLNNNGPSIHDIDDDGVPEVLLDGFVYDANGCLLNPDWTYANYLRLGLFPVVADVDGDGAPELVRHDGPYAWTGASWV